MMSPCDVVAERLALDEPLAELAQHADDCPRCQGLLAVQRSLSQSTSRRGDPTPAHGFASRMTVAANQRLVVRQRRRVVGYAALSAAAAAMVTFLVVRQPDPQQPAPVAASQPRLDEAAELPDPWKDGERPAQPSEIEAPDESPDEAAELPSPDEPIVDEAAELEGQPDEDAQALFQMSQGAARPVSANWKKIEAPLSAYDRLLQQVD